MLTYKSWKHYLHELLKFFFYILLHQLNLQHIHLQIDPASKKKKRKLKSVLISFAILFIFSFRQINLQTWIISLGHEQKNQSKSYFTSFLLHASPPTQNTCPLSKSLHSHDPVDNAVIESFHKPYVNIFSSCKIEVYYHKHHTNLIQDP